MKPSYRRGATGGRGGLSLGWASAPCACACEQQLLPFALCEQWLVIASGAPPKRGSSPVRDQLMLLVRVYVHLR